jgi:hypothetical protein
MLTQTQLKVILLLLDNKGHAGWELAKYLDVEDSNLNPILKDMERLGIIYQGEPRKSTRKHKKDGEYKEFPYYLCNNLDDFKALMVEITKTKRLYETSFILDIVKKVNI